MLGREIRGIAGAGERPKGGLSKAGDGRPKEGQSITGDRRSKRSSFVAGGGRPTTTINRSSTWGKGGVESLVS